MQCRAHRSTGDFFTGMEEDRELLIGPVLLSLHSWKYLVKTTLLPMKKLVSRRLFHHLITNLTVVGAGWVLAMSPAEGAIIWNGPPFAYTQPSPDPTQPANQDRLTADVWLTRGTTLGLFNAAMEGFFTRH